METWTGSRDELDQRAARLVAEAIGRAAQSQAQVVLGVVGGRSVGGIYHRLAGMDVPWKSVHVFLADERLVPVTSDESNFKLVRTDLLEGVIGNGKFPESNAHAFEFDAARPEAGVAAYSATLARLGGRFDVAILSAGEDGHCASLFPGHPSSADESEHFILVENSPKPPPRRISASRRLLQKTPLGLMVFYGEDKRAALVKFRDPTVGVLDCPSKVVESMARGVVVTDLS